MSDSGPAVELSEASVQRAGAVTWRNLDLTIDRGEFLAILGPNGAGKSTLLEVLLGSLPLKTGSATVLGRTPRAARSSVGYLPQRGGFAPGARVRGIDIVRLGLDGARWGVPVALPRRLDRGGRRRAARQRVVEAIDLVGAGAYAHRPIGALSGGEQQRLLIAQALIGRPQILMLDEPLDSLDLPNQMAVTSLVARLCCEQNVTVLLVAHDVNPLLGHLDRVVYLAGGRAVCGTPEQVITPETLSGLYGVPIEVLRASDGRLVVLGTPEAPAIHTPRHAHHAH